MTDDLHVARVSSQTIPGVAGRSLNSARTNHFIIDDPSYAGGPAEEITAEEAFLSGVSACAVLLVTRLARQDGMALQEVEAQIEGIRSKADPANFQSMNLRFALSGVEQRQAEDLVERFKGR
jgi:uncharacterized OsmC-like protein